MSVCPAKCLYSWMLLVPLLLLAGVFTFLASHANTPQLLTVAPDTALVDAQRGLRVSLTWRVASAGGARSSHGEFVDLDRNRVLQKVERPLAFGADMARLNEEVRLAPGQLRAWYGEGVRRLGYRRSFAGPAGSLSNFLLIDLPASGRLVALDAQPARQTLSGDSREMMVRWQLHGDIGGVRAESESGYFMVGDRVVYATGEPLFSDGGDTATERVPVPRWLVEDLLDGGIERIRYQRTFIDSRNGRRSAAVIVDLAR
ncbi:MULTISPECIES: hypothetical protein [unclassified Microbulbifer]|uniref:hypothetical protein n=1 Tax=unclassified Microbulbifer TaxID=2619833 RepID=UPI001E57798B|nr:hypothetical protein [Microbulbifer sp. YPW16]UHQ53640.1 hypothetical protein LVE68_08930 [Microbulbifer sp. YPW16]